MKILLILPPIGLEERYNKAKAAGNLPPLGLLYLAEVLKNKYKIKVFDGSIESSFCTVFNNKQTIRNHST